MARTLIIAAHPDDIDFGSGGSVARWTGEGDEVSYCIVTDGDAGGFDPSVPRSEIPGIRRAEQRAAADVLGAKDIDWLGWPDGRLYVTHELRRDIARSIRRHRPDRVVCQQPVRDMRSTYGSHPDHTAVGEAAMCAVYPDARNPFAHPELVEEGFEAWTVPEVWVVGSRDADTWVDITDTLDRKVEALRAHVSQTAHMEKLPEMMRKWGESQAKAGGLDEGRCAEGYLVINTG